MNTWLVKSEPDVWSWDQHMAKGVEPWSGVRNHQACNYMKAMRKGDRAFFYHSNIGKEVVGILEVAEEYQPDPTDESGRFGMVRFRALMPLKRPVTLAAIKAEPALADLLLLRQSRLSVMPVPRAAWRLISTMGGLKPDAGLR